MVFGRFILMLGLLAAIGLSIGLTTGCGTTSGGAAATEKAQVSIRIDYAARYNVEKATIAVLEGAGYVFTDRTQNNLLFHNPAGTVRFDMLVTTPEYRLNQVVCDVYELQDVPGVGTQWVPAAARKSEARQFLRDIKERARLL